MVRAILSLVLILASRAAAAPADIWRIGSRPPERAILLSNENQAESDARSELIEAESAMLARLAGAAGYLDQQAVKRLPEITLQAARSTDPAILDARRSVIVRLIAVGATKDVEILHTPDGRAAARELTGGLNAVVWLDRPGWEGLLNRSGHYQGPIRDASLQHEHATIFELDPPYTSGWFTLSTDNLSRRMYPGMRLRIRGSFRELERETLTCRLPAGYDPAKPAGLLAWIDPTDIGEPPTQLHAAADELNLIIVGARDAPNDRVIVDRFQLALDGVATACDRFHIDESRIYVTGMSGGGRASSILWSALPDVFAGAVPIVGLSHYRPVMVKGDELRAEVGKPRGWQAKALRSRRLAPMTGPIDFNYEEIVIRARQLAEDGFDIRLFEYGDMGHTMPTPTRFYDAIAWVDEPWQIARDETIARAGELLRDYDERFASGPASRTDRAREMLIEITRIAPWSGPAWRAVELLRAREGE